MRENRLRARACCRARSGIESGASRAAAVDAYYEPKTPVVICDTRDQIMQVLDAVWAHKVKKKLDEFVKAAGPKDEPGCLYSDIGPTLFGFSHPIQLKRQCGNCKFLPARECTQAYRRVP